MYFKQVLDERCGCASYVIASRKTREAAVIDPAIDTGPYEALLRPRAKNPSADTRHPTSLFLVSLAFPVDAS